MKKNARTMVGLDETSRGVPTGILSVLRDINGAERFSSATVPGDERIISSLGPVVQFSAVPDKGLSFSHVQLARNRQEIGKGSNSSSVSCTLGEDDTSSGDDLDAVVEENKGKRSKDRSTTEIQGEKESPETGVCNAAGRK